MSQYARTLNALLTGFAAHEKSRPLIAPGPRAGSAPAIELTLRHVHTGHVAGAARQVLHVPMATDNGGTQNDAGHELWPPAPPTGSYAEKKAIVEQLSRQGQWANCYAWSALNSCVWTNYSVLQSRIVVLGDGSIGVYGFYKGDVNQPLTLVMDWTMASTGVSLGGAGAVAYKAFEKAWAFARYLAKLADGTITSTRDDLDDENYGWMTDVFELLGIPAQNIYVTVSTVVGLITSNVSAGRAVSFGTPSAVTAGYVDDHAYSVDPLLNAVNPWGIDFPPMYLPIRQADATNYGTFLCVADLSKALAVPPPASPQVAPVPPAPAPPPPAPAPTGPAPTADPHNLFRPSSSRVVAGGAVSLLFIVRGAVKITLTSDVDAAAVDVTGLTRTAVKVARTTNYTLTALGPGGMPLVQHCTVVVAA